MKEIHTFICTHHTYMDDSQPINQPPQIINPSLGGIVKIEIEKLLYIKFIYPIFDS